MDVDVWVPALTNQQVFNSQTPRVRACDPSGVQKDPDSRYHQKLEQPCNSVRRFKPSESWSCAAQTRRHRSLSVSSRLLTLRRGDAGEPLPPF